MPLTTSAPTLTVSASSCPPPAADANGTAAFPEQSAQPTHLRLPAPARRTLGELVFVPRRLWSAYACHEHEGRGWTGRILSLTERSVLVAFPFAVDEHGRRYAPVRLPHAHVEDLSPSPVAGGTRETNDAATAEPADDPARPTQPTLANTPGVDSCSTPPPPRPCTPLPRQGRRV
eukprot:3105011-Pleurochrysis_carterae.AAC.2